MSSEELGSFRAFKELANKSFGLKDDDTAELIPLNIILARFESSTHLRSLVLTWSLRIERDDHYYKDLSAALDIFRRQLAKTIEIPESKLVSLQCIPIAEDVFNTNTQSDSHRQFCATYRDYYRFNVNDGSNLFDFMLANFVEENAHFRRLNRGMRSRVVLYARSLKCNIFHMGKQSVWSGVGISLRYAFENGLRVRIQ